MLTLKDLVRKEGYELVIDDGAADHPDALGTPQRDELCAQACKGNVIRMRSGLAEEDAWYPVSHEIAEDRTDFRGHTQKLWREQLNILSRWCARLAADNAAQAERALGLEEDISIIVSYHAETETDKCS
jgi:hypothetical protein